MSQAERWLIEQFYRAIERQDFDALATKLYAKDAEIWHNVDNKIESAEQNISALKGLGTIATAVRYDLTSAFDIPGGVIQQSTVNFTLLNGKSSQLFTCAIFYVKDGRIARLEEYYDAAGLQQIAAFALS